MTRSYIIGQRTSRDTTIQTEPKRGYLQTSQILTNKDAEIL